MGCSVSVRTQCQKQKVILLGCLGGCKAVLGGFYMVAQVKSVRPCVSGL